MPFTTFLFKKIAEFTPRPFGGCDFHFFISLELVAVMSLEKQRTSKLVTEETLRDMTK